MMKRLLIIFCIPVLLLFGGPSEGYAFDEVSLTKLRAMNQCANCDLSGVNLSKAKLSGRAKLSGADLRGADLSGAKLMTQLNGTNLTDVDLTTTVLGRTKLTNAILCRTKVPWGVENRDCK